MKKTGAKIKSKPRGRPAGGKLSREAILERAGRELNKRGLKSFSMRSLAASLKADPMAVYHYFAGRDALLNELAVRHFREFRYVFKTGGNARSALRRLGRAYVEHMGERVELLLFLTAVPGAFDEPARIMSEHFAQAASAWQLSPASLKIANNVFFDFLHGYALGVGGGAETGAMFRRELDIVLNGIEGSGG